MDDDETASEAEAPRVGPQRKLLAPEEVEAKVEWTDESGNEALKRENKKRGRKRKTPVPPEATDTAPKRPRGRPPANAANAVGHPPRARPATQPAGAPNRQIPDYLIKRRQQFDDKHKRLGTDGLLLPPDYSDIDFSEEDNLRRRPKFDHIRPCRESKEHIMEFSGGVIPASIAQYLRDYQIDGVEFLHKLFVFQKGGILGDDMGLGKTVQVAALLAAAFGKTGDERDARRMRKMRRIPGRWYPRVLILCPGSLTENWQNELNRWGFWHTGVYHGPERRDVLQTARSGRLEVMITTYATYRGNEDAVNEVEWDAVIADECQHINNRTSAVTQSLDRVNALCRIGLTGTAIQNNLDELWVLLNWTNPGRFGTISDWQRSISIPITLGQSSDASVGQLSLGRRSAKMLVNNLLPQFFLRRLKTLLAHQLPKKTDRVVFCPLSDMQHRAYKNLLDSPECEYLRGITDPCDQCDSNQTKGACHYKKFRGGKSWQSMVFPTLVALQKMSGHLSLLIPAANEGTLKRQNEIEMLQICLGNQWEDFYRDRESLTQLSNPELCGKWKVLRKLLAFWRSNGDKVLIFSHSKKILRILKLLFAQTAYSVSYLDGEMTFLDRQREVDDFNANPDKFVFLLSTKAGGVGLNITSANKVVIFDPHWNPAHDLQAQDRAYRIGQLRDVDVFRLISAGTIEEIIYARQIYKQQQANIAYSASTERRYFRGVQQDSERRGEIFGLQNMLTFHGGADSNSILLRDIVNKTNIAEAKAGVGILDIDIKAAADDFEAAKLRATGGAGAKRDMLGGDHEEASAKELANLLSGGDSQLRGSVQSGAKIEDGTESATRAVAVGKRPMDAIHAILAAAGVSYTHENSEVVGSSRVEEHISRQAEIEAAREASYKRGSLFADEQAANTLVVDRARQSLGKGGLGAGGTDRGLAVGSGNGSGTEPSAAVTNLGIEYRYQPPEDVRERQFCSMAREFGFTSATDFAFVVEGWTQEERRLCLEIFYRRREAMLRASGTEKDDVKAGVKPNVASEADEDAKRRMDESDLETGDEAPAAKVEVKDSDDKGLIKVKLERIGSGMRSFLGPTRRGGLSTDAGVVKTERLDDRKISGFGRHDDDDEDDEL